MKQIVHDERKKVSGRFRGKFGQYRHQDSRGVRRESGAASLALETAQEDEELIGPGVLTLKHGIDALSRVYTDLDLAILRLD